MSARRFSLVDPELKADARGQFDCSLSIAEANEDDSGAFEVLVALNTRDGVYTTLSQPFQVNVTCARRFLLSVLQYRAPDSIICIYSSTVYIF